MKRTLLDELNAARDGKRAVAVVTDLADGAQALVYGADTEADSGLAPAVVAEARRALTTDRSGPFEAEDRTLFIHVYNPPLRLIIVGAVHITQALAQIADIAGYAVTIIDPRRGFAQSARFPRFTVATDWPDEVMKAAPPDGRTAIVTLSHDPKIDDPALETVLRSPAFYIGSLGSKRTHGKRLARLREKGFGEAELARINGPIGLDIGAKSPAEIAVSIMAQITQARHGKGS